jgi:SprT protein
MLTTTQKQQIAEKIEACFVTCEARFNRTFRRPSVKYALRGTTAGTAHPGKWELNFHPVLAAENWEDYINNTVPHEVAHLIDYDVYRRDAELAARQSMFRGRRQKRSIHGPTWKSIMRILGCDPSRCHSYDTSGVARRKTRHNYHCTCGHVWELGPKYHKNIQTGARQYRCTKCKSQLTAAMFRGIPTKPASPPKSKATAAPRAPAPGSKIEGAVKIVRENTLRDRGIVITKIMNELGMSYAGAQTYYYKAKQIIG